MNASESALRSALSAGQDPDDAVARIAELVGNACDEVLTSLEGVINVDWNDFGEVTIVTVCGTFRLTAEKLAAA